MFLDKVQMLLVSFILMHPFVGIFLQCHRSIAAEKMFQQLYKRFEIIKQEGEF